MEISVTNRNSI